MNRYRLILAAWCGSFVWTLGAEATIQVRDSLGIRIAETPAEAARSGSLLTIDQQPTVQIGSVQGDPAYLFSGISGVAIVSGVRIAVLNQATTELRLFDDQGRFREVRGRRGPGPGEFELPRLLEAGPGDSLLIYDSANRRFTLFSTTDEGYRIVSPSEAARGQIIGSPIGLRDGHVLAISGSLPLRREVGPAPFTLHARLVDLESGAMDTVAVVESMQVLITNPRGPPLMTSVPHAPFLPAALSPSGFFTVSAVAPEIHEHSPADGLERVIRVLEEPNRVTEAEFQAALEEQINRRVQDGTLPPGVIRRDYDGLRPPESLPSFSTVVVDEEGWIWARRYQGSSVRPDVWLVFDPEGRGRGEVQMPEGLTVGHISRDFVAGSWRDELGIEYVRLHRIQGRP